MITDLPVLSYDDLGVLMSKMRGDEKHTPAADSTAGVLYVLYTRVLRLEGPDPDRFLLSKGHGPQAYYAVLAGLGLLDSDVLTTFGRFDSPLGHHPDRQLLEGVEISSGSLGHGLAIALGLALGLESRGSEARVFCLLGDGELDEGSNHEAIAVAGRRRCARLTAVVVDNGSSSLGWPGGLARRFSVEGWEAATVDGRDHGALETALTMDGTGAPRVVVAEVGDE